MADTRVVIVGAGPVGLITALGLARRGIDVTLFEAGTPETAVAAPDHSQSLHDMVYHWSALPGLDRLGVLDDLRSAGLVGRTWTILVNENGERIKVDLTALGDRVEFPYTLHICRNALTQVVMTHLAQYRNVHIHNETRISTLEPTRDDVIITADGPDGQLVTTAEWVIGTDGAHSLVRRSIGLGFAGWTWPHRFVATTTAFDWSDVGFSEITHCIGDPWPAVAGRIDDWSWRFVYAEPHSLPQDETEQRILGVFRAATGENAGPQLTAWRTYRIHERAADSFRHGRVLLAGDAAHVTNPTLGMGGASGLLDAYTLTDALSSVLEGSDDNLLDEYAIDRRRAFLQRTSPLSVRSMHALLGTGGLSEKQAAVELYRKIAMNPDALAEYYGETNP